MKDPIISIKQRREEWEHAATVNSNILQSPRDYDNVTSWIEDAHKFLQKVHYVNHVNDDIFSTDELDELLGLIRRVEE